MFVVSASCICVSARVCRIVDGIWNLFLWAWAYTTHTAYHKLLVMKRQYIVDIECCECVWVSENMRSNYRRYFRFSWTLCRYSGRSCSYSYSVVNAIIDETICACVCRVDCFVSVLPKPIYPYQKQNCCDDGNQQLLEMDSSISLSKVVSAQSQSQPEWWICDANKIWMFMKISCEFRDGMDVRVPVYYVYVCVCVLI